MKKGIFVKITALLAIVAMILTVFSSCSAGHTKIALRDYVTVDFAGFNGYCKPSLTVDYAGLNEIVDAKAMKKYVAKVLPEMAKMNEAVGEYCDLSEFIGITLATDYENLKNGDTVKVILDLSGALADTDETLKSLEKGLGIKFDTAEIDFVVEGLADAKVFDAFTNIESCITYEGGNGFGTAKIVLPETANWKIDDIYLSPQYGSYIQVIRNNSSLGTYSITLAPASGLSKGDKITASLSNSAALVAGLQSIGYIIPEQTHEYTVPDLGIYINEYTQLNATDLAVLKDAALEKLNTAFAGSELCGAYFGTVKPSAVSGDNGKATYVLVAKKVGSGLFSWTTYNAVIISNIIKTSDGKLVTNDIKMNCLYRVDEDTQILESLNAGSYNYVKL